MDNTESNSIDGSGPIVIGDVELDLSGLTLIPYRPKPFLSLVPAKADQIAALYQNLTGKEMSGDSKKSLADKLREQGWTVNQKSSGGIVITGVEPPAPKPE